MLSAKYRRIHHYHLKKCGGSTLNRWLDTLTDDGRACDPAWIGSWLLGDPDHVTDVAQMQADVLAGHALFHWSDVVHTHAPIRPYAPEGTFCFTLLRDPVDRLVSQVADWRRLLPDDSITEPPAIQAMIQDAGRLPLRAFLLQYGPGAGRLQLDNYMTRALAAARAGREGRYTGDAAVLLDDALAGMESDYDLVGLTEAFDPSRNALCAAVGLPPVRDIHRMNVTKRLREADPEVADAADVLNKLTRLDRLVYARAKALFRDRYEAKARSYDTANFEATSASGLLKGLRGSHCGGTARYSVRSPLTGAGIHGRDSAGTAQCAVWTGPETTTTLYVPVPPHMQLSLMVWIRGYAARRQREHLWIKVDGRPAVHRFEPLEGYADLLLVDACSTRDFVRLEIEVGETLTSAEAGCADRDDRKRGISFDSYGWRLVRPTGRTQPRTASFSTDAPSGNRDEALLCQTWRQQAKL